MPSHHREEDKRNSKRRDTHSSDRRRNRSRSKEREQRSSIDLTSSHEWFEPTESLTDKRSAIQEEVKT